MMATKYTTCEEFRAENMRCGTCIWFEARLFGGHCSLPRHHSTTLADRNSDDDICGEYWDPIPSVSAEYDEVIAIEMREIEQDGGE